jgi:hypothetical protein
MEKRMRGFRDLWIAAAISLIVGGGVGLYALSQGQNGTALSMLGIFGAGLTIAVGSHYLKKRISLIVSIVIAASELRTNPQASDNDLTAKIKAEVPGTTDEKCLVAVGMAKQYLSNPESLAPWILNDVKKWDTPP